MTDTAGTSTAIVPSIIAPQHSRHLHPARDALQFLLGQLDDSVDVLVYGLGPFVRGDSFYTPYTNKIAKGYKENSDFFLCAYMWSKYHILSTKVAHRHKDDSGHWHDAEVKVHGDKLVITYEDEDA